MAAGGLIRVWKRPFRAPAGPIAPLRGARGPSTRPFSLRLSAPAVQAPPASCTRRPHCPLRGARGPPARPFPLRLSASAVQARPASCTHRPHCTPAGSARPTRPALSLRLSAPAVQAPPAPCARPALFPPFVRPHCAGPSRSVRDMYRLVNSHLDFAQIFRIFAFAKEGNRCSGCPLAFYKAGSGGIWRRDGQN